MTEDEIAVADLIAVESAGLRSKVNTLYDGWQQRYAARAAIVTFLTNRNVTPDELRDALRQLL